MSSQDKKLAGKTAVVTGAGRGIGRSIAITFARAGANVAICARSTDELADTCKEIEAHGVTCVQLPTNLVDAESTQRFCTQTLDTFGQVDVLVNNAGGMIEKSSIAESDADRWWSTVELNIRAPYLITRQLLSGLSDHAKIINVSSGVGLRAGQKNSAYHVAKAGLHMFTEALANELVGRGIEVNNLIPGPVATSAFDNKTDGSRSSPDAILANYADAPPVGMPETR
jgi:3-oxoacyl-[acyl-carrier protein] reductase